MSDIPLSFLFAALVLLIALSAFFSGSETALMTLNRYRLRHLAERGHTGAQRARHLLERPDRLIGLILLGNNFVNILASSITTIIALRLGGEGVLAAAAGLLTFVILIFAEVAPKTLAALHPEKLAFPAAFIYTPLLKLLLPLVWVVNMIANALLKRFGVSPEGANGQVLSREELRTVVIEAGAMIPERHQKMLLSILDLEKITVEDILIPRHEVDGIDLNDPLDEIIDALRSSPYSRLPVYEGNIDNIVGVLRQRDTTQALLEGKLTEEKIREICRPPYYVPEGTPLTRQLLNFQHKKRRFAFVVDEYGDILGIVTLADLLEQIVGEFTTDPSGEVPFLYPQEDGTYLVDGSASIRDLVRALDWPLPTDGPKTLNGLILEYLETIPEPGTSLKLAGFPVEIIQCAGNAVKTVKVFPSGRKKKPKKATINPETQ